MIGHPVLQVLADLHVIPRTADDGFTIALAAAGPGGAGRLGPAGPPGHRRASRVT